MLNEERPQFISVRAVPKLRILYRSTRISSTRVSPEFAVRPICSTIKMEENSKEDIATKQLFTKRGCRGCQFTYSGKEENFANAMRVHRTRCKSKQFLKYVCEWCPTELTSKNELDKHKRENKRACGHCVEKFKTCQELHEHMQLQHLLIWESQFGKALVPSAVTKGQRKAPDLTANELELLKQDFKDSKPMEAMNETLFSHVLMKWVSDDELVVEPTKSQMLMAKPFGATQLLKPAGTNIVYLVCKIQQDSFSLIVVNLSDQSIYYLSPKFNLCPRTTLNISRLVAGLYNALQKEFVEGASQLYEYNSGMKDMTHCSELYIIYYLLKLLKGKKINSNKDMKVFKELLVKQL